MSKKRPFISAMNSFLMFLFLFFGMVKIICDNVPSLASMGYLLEEDKMAMAEYKWANALLRFFKKNPESIFNKPKVCWLCSSSAIAEAYTKKGAPANLLFSENILPWK